MVAFSFSTFSIRGWNLFFLTRAAHSPRERLPTKKPDGVFVELPCRISTDPFRQIIGENVLFEEIGRSGDTIAREEAEYTLRWALRQEMNYILEIAGFEIVALYSDFDRAPPVYGKEQILVVRRK
jgi:hypothetical protein